MATLLHHESQRAEIYSKRSLWAHLIWGQEWLGGCLALWRVFGDPGSPQWTVPRVNWEHCFMVNGLVSSDTPATPFSSEPEPPSYSPAIPFLLPWGLEPFPFPFDFFFFFFYLALAASGKCFLQSICPGSFLLGAQTLPWFSLFKSKRYRKREWALREYHTYQGPEVTLRAPSP